MRKQLSATCPWGAAREAWGCLAELRAPAETWPRGWLTEAVVLALGPGLVGMALLQGPVLQADRRQAPPH